MNCRQMANVTCRMASETELSPVPSRLTWLGAGSAEVSRGVERRPRIDERLHGKDRIMLSKDQDIAVAVYDEHSTAEEAVKTLQRRGFDMK
jgi:hypothetical protein